MKTGDGLIAIRFNEAVRALPTEIQLKKANSTGSFSTHVRIEDYFVEYHGEFLLIDLGELEAGEYFADVSFFASDSSGNESEQSQLSLTFVVSDTPLSGVAFNRFDVDQNGTVDRSDLNLLIDWSGRNHLSTNSNRDDVPAPRGATIGRGPTRLMSPFRTLKSWGNSSSEVERSRWPTHA